jgi:hypothetical protein
MEHLGDFAQNPWAWDAYFAFWLMAGIRLVPDVTRYSRNRHADDPKHGLPGGAVRAMIATPLMFFILWTMAVKESVLAVHLFGL